MNTRCCVNVMMLTTIYIIYISVHETKTDLQFHTDRTQLLTHVNQHKNRDNNWHLSCVFKIVVLPA